MPAQCMYRVLGAVGLVILAATGCVRAKPERSLPSVEQVFDSAEVEAHAVAATATAPLAITDATVAPTLEATPTSLPVTSTPAEPTIMSIATDTPAPQATAVPPTAAPTSTFEPTMPPTPSPTIAATSAAARSTAELTSYEVQSGDTFYSLAVLHGTTMVALLEANDLEEIAPLQVGQIIWLPANAAPYSGPDIQTTNYWARRGETLAGIAHRYKTTVTDILAANPGLSEEDALYTGLYLIIPVNTAR